MYFKSGNSATYSGSWSRRIVPLACMNHLELALQLHFGEGFSLVSEASSSGWYVQGVQWIHAHVYLTFTPDAKYLRLGSLKTGIFMQMIC